MLKPIAGCLLLALLAPADATAGEEQRRSAHEAVQAHLEAEQYGEALEVAQHSVRQTEQEVGPEGVELVAPLLDLGKAQGLSGEHAAAETSYNRAISIIEAEAGPYDRRLVEPLSGRGDVYVAQRRYEEAIDSFQRARHIWHRVDGINTLQQLDVLDRLAQGFLGAGELVEANRAKIRAFRIAEHHHGRDSLESVPAMRELADWYLRTGQYRGAVILYQRALTVLENAVGTDDPRLIPLLNGFASARGAGGYRAGQAEDALERVLSILEQQPEVGVLEHVDALLALGDWHIQSDNGQLAQDYYRRAWSLLAADPEHSGELDTIFGRPVNLRFPRMPGYIPIPPVPYREVDPRTLPERYVLLEYRVEADGTVSDVEIVEADAPHTEKFLVSKRMRTARYRPRLVDGEPVDSRMRLRQVIPPIRPRYHY